MANLLMLYADYDHSVGRFIYTRYLFALKGVYSLYRKRTRVEVSFTCIFIGTSKYAERLGNACKL